MQRVEVLKQQAELLRRMAASFHALVIKEDLLNIAERCETVAERVRLELLKREQRPIADVASSTRSTKDEVE